MSKQTKSIGVNTDLNLQNKCSCQETMGKMNFIPYFLPFPYPCHCMLTFWQKTLDENMNQCNSHYCLHCSSSTCKNCSNKSSVSSEEKPNTVHSEPNIKSDNEDNVTASSTTYKEEYSKRSYYQTTNEEQSTINHLLKPNALETEDSEESESDNENINEDSYSCKTVLQKDLNDRRPTRINLPTKSTQSLPQKQNKNSEAEMLMMIKALVNNQYSNSSPELNKLLNHIGTNPGNKLPRTHLQK